MKYYQKFAEMISQMDSSKNIIINKKLVKSLSEQSVKRREKDIVNIDKDYEVTYSSLLNETYDLFGNIHCHWFYRKEAKEIPGGEFRFEEFGKVFYLDNHLYVSNKNEKTKNFLSELKPFEDHPISGDGIVVALEIKEGSTTPRLWLYDNGEFYMLTIDLTTYLNMLLLTMGFFNWQYLFIENFKKIERYSVIKPQLSVMMQTLPQLFPYKNYGLLKIKHNCDI